MIFILICFFRRFQELTAIEISSSILDELSEISSLFEMEFLLIPSDIVSVGAKVKHLNVIDEAEAKMLVYKAKESFGQRSKQLWNTINRKFEAAISSNTASIGTLLDWASSLLRQAKQAIDEKDAINSLAMASEKVNTAVSYYILYKKGKFRSFVVDLDL